MVTYKKKLEGVHITDDLKRLYEKAKTAADDDEITAKAEAAPPTSEEEDTTSKDIRVTASDHDEKNTTTSSIIAPPSLQEARQTLLKDYSLVDNIIPIRVIRSMDVVLGSQKQQQQPSDQQQLQMALRNTRLAFTTPPPPPQSKNNSDDEQLTKEQQKFQKRLERLRNKQEETRYSKITSNLASMKSQPEDMNVKSMTYAASIGLNMIVAPISFGVFMYFFAGSVLDYFWNGNEDATNNSHHHVVDIKRVIMGVISGVIMLFIEMLLFVIRTHEMDKAMTRKQRRHQKQHRNNPFSVYTSTTTKTYQD